MVFVEVHAEAKGQFHGVNRKVLWYLHNMSIVKNNR
jgi:hypothetical protein